jgi:hypothetical protein
MILVVFQGIFESIVPGKRFFNSCRLTGNVDSPFFEGMYSTYQDNTINFWPRLGVMVDDHSKPNELRKESYNLARMEERYPHERYLPAY